MGSSATQRATGSRFGDQAYGLFVGVTTFRDPAYSKRPLPQAQRDATGVADVLRSRLGWKPANIEVLAGTVTKAAIRDGFLHIRERIAQAKECDLFLLFVSTHGHIYERVRRGKTTTLLATDTLLHDPLVLADTGLTPDILGAYVDSIPARQKLIISDACFASSGMSAADISPPETYRDIDAAVLSAAVGRSYAPDQDAPSLFSGHLIEILQHMEGEVGLGTVFDLISRSIPKDVQSPYLETHARYIVLGVVTGTVVAERVASFDDIVRFAEATFQFTLGRFLSDGWSESNYVHRHTLEQKFKSYLEGDDLDIFSVVGGAGTGKTTALLYLAQQARRDDFPVFWFSHIDLSTYPTPISALVGSLQGLDKSLTADNVENLLRGKGPLVVFFDAVNEWSSDSSQLAHFYMELKNASTRNLRIVIACRDEAWPTIATHISGSLPKDMVAKPTYRLENFDDREFEEVRQRYSKVFFGDVQILRHPLFLRLILDLRNVSDASGSRLFYSAVLVRYVDLKLSKIEQRYGLTARRTMGAIEDLMHVFEQRRTQALATIEFFQVVSDVVGSALLEEGLVRRTGDLIAIENEIIHQFLLSRILPSDPFASSDWRDRSFSDPWWGASAFKLLEMPGSERVGEIMRDLLAWEPAAVLYILNVLARMDDVSPFRNVLLNLSEDARVFDSEILEFISTLLNRRESDELPLVIALLRLLFLDTLQDWRLKAWSDSSPQAFRWNVSNPDGSAAHVLLRCMDTYPGATIETLIEVWLLDPTTLADGEAHIRDVAYAFLLYVGLDHPEMVANAIEKASESFHQGTESGLLLHRIIRDAGSSIPTFSANDFPAETMRPVSVTAAIWR
jgi:Caspase domain